MADKRIDQLVAATTIGNNDLFVLEQNNQAKKLSGSTLASFVYNAAADKIEEVNQAVADAQDAVDSLEEQKDTIAQSIADMAQYGTDTTLTTPGIAADAEATGNRISAVEADALAALDQGEITGVPIASFDDGADNVPVKALSVAIDPVQDLHGYDSPWPAGGGKNLLNYEEFFSSQYSTLQSCTVSIASNGTIIVNVTDTGSVWVGTTTISVGATLSSASITIPASQGQTFVASGIGAYCTYIELDSSNVILSASDVSHLSSYTVANASCVNISIRLVFGSKTSGDTVNGKFQIEKASTATAWTPYSNICSITGWTEAKVTRTGKNLFDKDSIVVPIGVTASISGETITATTTSSTSNRSVYYDIPAKNFIGKMLNLSGSQTTSTGSLTSIILRSVIGVETTTNLATSTASNFSISTVVPNCDYIRIFMPLTSGTGATGVTRTFSNIQLEIGSSATTYEPYAGETYDIAFPLAAGTVYGGTLDVTKGKLTVDNQLKTYSGSSSWTADNGVNGYALYNALPYSTTRYQGYCNMFKVLKTGDATSNMGVIIGGTNKHIYVTQANLLPDVSDVASWKTFLNGNNLVLTIPLATPIEYDLTPTEVRTLLALNNIWADTGNILDLIYRRKPVSDADLQEQIDSIRDVIADREDTGVASQNYIVGSLIIVGNTLYEAVVPISTGETISTSTNVIETTVAAQIAYLKTIVNGLGNLAYLSYETV